MKQHEQLIADIARDHLGIATLTTRNSDSLDFHHVAVWQAAAALKTAFDAGAQSAARNADTHDNATSESIPVTPTTPLLVPSGSPLLPGKMYLRLYHGRTDPNQDLDSWGFKGPTFGPLSGYVHTYCCTFRIHGDSDATELWLDSHGDMIRWDGCFYGDMEIFIAEPGHKA